MSEDHGRCLQAGCDGYASKPIAHEELIKLVAHHARRADREARMSDGHVNGFASGRTS